VGVSKGVIDVDVGISSQFLGELVVVFFFPRVEPQVLQHDDVSGFHPVDGLPDLGPDHVFCQGHVLAEKPREPLGHGSQAHLFDSLAFWPAEVGDDDDFCVFIQGKVDGGQNGTDSRVVGDVLVCIEGDVEVEPEHHPLPF